MKEITEVLKAAYHWGRDNGEGRSDKNFNDFLNTSVVSKLEFFVNQEVEKRIAERMPSEEEINHEAADRFADKKTGHVKPHLWATFRSGAKWYRSRLTQKTGLIFYVSGRLMCMLLLSQSWILTLMTWLRSLKYVNRNR